MAFRHILTSAAQPTDAFSLQTWLHLNNNIRFISKKLCCNQKIIDQKQIYSFIYLLFMTTQAASPVAINYVWFCLVWEWKRRVKRATQETRTSATTQRCRGTSVETRMNMEAWQVCEWRKEEVWERRRMEMSKEKMQQKIKRHVTKRA